MVAGARDACAAEADSFEAPGVGAHEVALAVARKSYPGLSDEDHQTRAFPGSSRSATTESAGFQGRIEAIGGRIEISSRPAREPRWT
jgi:hypothetical protein